VQNSPLAQALVADLEHDNLATASDYDRLNLSVMPFMEKNIQSLIDCVDDLVGANHAECHYAHGMQTLTAVFIRV